MGMPGTRQWEAGADLFDVFAAGSGRPRWPKPKAPQMAGGSLGFRDGLCQDGWRTDGDIGPWGVHPSLSFCLPSCWGCAGLGCDMDSWGRSVTRGWCNNNNNLEEHDAQPLDRSAGVETVQPRREQEVVLSRIGAECARAGDYKIIGEGDARYLLVLSLDRVVTVAGLCGATMSPEKNWSTDGITCRYGDWRGGEEREE
jgi:hypothetical protein